MVQTPSPTLVHRDLRQRSTRATFVGSHKLRITDRAPAPPPEPGSSSAPIVIDEDDEPTSTPADEPMKVDPPTPVLSNTEATPTALDHLDVQGSKGDAQNDLKPQPDQVISEQLPQDNASATQVESRPLVPEHELSATSTPQASVVATQSPSVPSTSVPFASVRPATPPSETLAPSDSTRGDPSEVQLQPAMDRNAQGNIVEDIFGSSSIDIVAAPNAEDTEVTPPDAATTSSTAIVIESSPTLVTSPDADRPGPLSNVAEPRRTIEDVAPMSVDEASPAAGGHQRSPTPSDGDDMSISLTPHLPLSRNDEPKLQSVERRVGAEERSNAEGQQDLSITQSDVVGTPATTTVGLGAGPLEDVNGATETVVSQVPFVSSLNPTIAVLGTRSRGSSASSDSRSISPPPEKKFADSGNVPVKAEELEEDEMEDELAPLFGKEMSVICMDRAYDIPTEFTWNFTLLPADWARVSQWVKAPECLECVHPSLCFFNLCSIFTLI